jgi:hypothetical protein
MENTLDILDQYQSIILIGMGLITLLVVLTRTRNQTEASTQNTIGNIAMRPETETHSSHINKQTSVTINGKSFSDINEIEDPETREKVRKAMEIAKQIGFSKDNPSGH